MVGGFLLPTSIDFFHTNIISYAKRPFSNAPQMNKTLIKNHNSVVKDSDTTYHIGDFCFGSLERIESIIKQLNGQHILILGNHDTDYKWSDYIRAGFSSVQRFSFIDFPGIGPVGLAHDPSCCILDLDVPWICGHLHQQFDKMNNCVNAGVDVRNYTPVSEADMFILLSDTKKFHMKLDPNAAKEFGATYGLKEH